MQLRVVTHGDNAAELLTRVPTSSARGCGYDRRGTAVNYAFICLAALQLYIYICIYIF